jgi:hypothetical protein
MKPTAKIGWWSMVGILALYPAWSAAASGVTVPAGTKIMIQLTQGVSTAKKSEGKKFMGTLQGDLKVGETVVAPNGSQVYGTVVKIKGESGRKGMGVVLDQLTINGVLTPIKTHPMEVKGPSAAAGAAGGAVKGAVVGSMVGGPHSRSTSNGAAIGAVAGAAKAKNSAGIPAGELLEFVFAEPLTI